MKKKKFSIERAYSRKKITNKPTIYKINKEYWDTYIFDTENELIIGDLVLTSDYRLAYILDFNYNYGKKSVELRHLFKINSTDTLFDKQEISSLRLIQRKEHSRIIYKMLDYFECDFFIYTEWIELINGKYSKNKIFDTFSKVNFLETSKKGKVIDTKYNRKFKLCETVGIFNVYSGVLYTGYAQEEEKMFYIHNTLNDEYYYGGMDYQYKTIINILKSNIKKGNTMQKIKIS